MFQAILIAPLYNCFIYLIGATNGNVGLAIIILTLGIRAIFYPAFTSSIKTQMGMQLVQDDLAEINKIYKNNPDEKAKRTMELFKEKKISPFSGFLALLVQIPIFFALYFAFFREGLPHIETQLLYSFVHTPVYVSTTFLGFINLLTPHNILLSVIVALTQYVAIHFSFARTSSVQSKQTPEQEAAQRMQRVTMLYGMPVILAVLTFTFPAAVGVYFVTGNTVSVIQEWLIKRSFNKQKAFS